MLIVGLTGGIGSGKSTALRAFKRLGAKVIDADSLAREVVTPGRPAWRKIKEEFGKPVFHRNNKLNRKKLASVVFGDAKSLKKLNAIIHPEVLKLERGIIADIKKRNKNAVVVVDAPLMIEAGQHKWKDIMVVIDCAQKLQMERMVFTKRFARKDIQKRIDAQMPLKKKLRYADYVLDNNGSLSGFRQKVSALFGLIKKRGGKK